MRLKIRLSNTLCYCTSRVRFDQINMGEELVHCIILGLQRSGRDGGWMLSLGSFAAGRQDRRTDAG